MNKLLIIGARGWGREVLWSFKADRKDLEIKGFLDDNVHALDGLTGDFPPIVSSVEDYQIQPDDVFFCAVGDPYYRKKYADIIEEKGGKFVTYVNPHSFVSPHAKIKEGSFIGLYTIISDNVVIGKHAMIHGFCTIGHDVTIGDYVSMEAYCFMGGYAEIGDSSSIHVRSTILSHKKVGKGASVGATSLVIRNVKDGTNVFGIPAKKIY